MQLNSQNFKGIFIKFGNIPNCLKGCFLCGYHISNNRVQEQKVSLFSIPFLGRDICFSKKDEINQEIYIFFKFSDVFAIFVLYEFRWSLNLHSTPRSRKIDKILAKFFQSFISPQIIAAPPVGFLFLKALYLSFQMHTS